MRGKDLTYCENDLGAGITPAYAGKSSRLQYGRHSDRDHPRLCGEKSIDSTDASDIFGITPAYAGKRLFR